MGNVYELGFKGWCGPIGREGRDRLDRSREPDPRPRKALRPGFEALECRRLLSAGDLDPTFGGSGTVTIAAAPGVQSVAMNAEAIESDGKLVVAGSADGNFSVARLNTDGTLDTSFGADGRCPIPFSSNYPSNAADGVAIQPDGKIVVSGTVGFVYWTSATTYTATHSFGVARLDPNGTLDTTFGTGGIQSIPFGSDSNTSVTAAAIVLQPNGQVVVVGDVYNGVARTDEFAVARLNADGSLDTTFGTSGKQAIAFNLTPTNYDYARAVALQPDGKIVVVGNVQYNTSGAQKWGLARLNPNGSLDPSFGTGGTLVTAVTKVNGYNDYTSGVALQPNGEIVVVGTSGPYGGSNIDLGVARFNPNGSPDTSFANGGSRTIALDVDFTGADSASALAIQPDGKIVIAGSASDGGQSGSSDPTGFAIVRLDSDGVLDPTFQGDGLKLINFTSLGLNSAIADAVALQSDGNIVVLGRVSTAYWQASTVFAVARLIGNPPPPPLVAGSLDPTLAGSGGLMIPFGMNGGADAVAVQPDGRIIIAGDAQRAVGTTFAVARLNPDGSLDTTFGTGGLLTFAFAAGDTETVTGVAVQPNGEIVVAGYLIRPDNSAAFAVARLNPDGSLDTTFGTGGEQTIGFGLGGTEEDEAVGVLLQPDGKIVIAGSASTASLVSNFAVARLNTNGSLDATFGSGGKTVFNFSYEFSQLASLKTTQNDRPAAVTLQPDGKIVVAGTAVTSGSAGYEAIARLNPDGSLDQGFGLLSTSGLLQTGKQIFVITTVTNPDQPYDDTAQVRGVAVQPDGKIVVAGSVVYYGYDNQGLHRLAVVRLLSNGSADTSFGSSGCAVPFIQDPQGDDAANGVAIQADGKIVLAGTTRAGFTGTTVHDFGVFRLLSNGSPDTSFNGSGRATVSFDNGGITESPANGLALQADGKIVVVGYALGGAANAKPNAGWTNFAVARLFGSTPILTVPDNYVGALNTTLTVAAAIGVLANDTDAASLPLTAVVVSGPAHGVLTLNADGSFTYTPAAGYAGTDGFVYDATDGTLTSAATDVTITIFAPPQAANDAYSTLDGTILTVAAAQGVLANDTDPQGLPLTATLVTAAGHGTVVLDADGSFTYTPAAGFSGTDTFTYEANDVILDSSAAKVTLTVNKGIETIAWANPSAIVYGTPLGSAQLNATVTAPFPAPSGTFTYAPAAGAVLHAGAGQVLSVTFTPIDTVDYNPVTASVTINVLLATPTVAWANATAIVYGTPLGASQLDATANVPGIFTYSPGAGTVLHPGAAQLLTVTFTPTDTTDFTTGSGTSTINVSAATPMVTWPNPANIVYGTALGIAQLDATANTAGTFTYNLAVGVYLNAGSGQALSVTFVPQDLADFLTITESTTITVEKATPMLELSDRGGIFNGNPFPASVTITGSGADKSPEASIEGVTPTLTYYDGSVASGLTLGSTPPTATGTYSVVASFAGSADYSAVQSAPLTFTIGAAVAAIALTSSTDSAVYGQPVTLVAIAAADVTPSGAVTFRDGVTTLAVVALDGSGKATLTTSALALGIHSITATYSGGADLGGAQSRSDSVSVAQSGTTIVLVPHPVLMKKRVVSEVMTARIGPTSPGGGFPTGVVTFERLIKKGKRINTKNIGTAAVSGGYATLTVKANLVLMQTISIVYSGDANFRSSTVLKKVSGTVVGTPSPDQVVSAEWDDLIAPQPTA